MKEHCVEKIAVLDFGGQYAHLIANRIRRMGVYSEILHCDVDASELCGFKGIILSGGPGSVLDANSPKCDPGIFNLGIPLMGLCYGHQLLSNMLGGDVSKSPTREYGRAVMDVINPSSILKDLQPKEQIWMSHGDTVKKLPPDFEILAKTSDCDSAVICNLKKKIFGLQFHPEVTDTPNGAKVLGNFIDICNCSRSWNPSAFIEQIKDEIKTACSGKKVFLLVSGGVDSTVAFTLLNKVLGPEKVMGLHVDNGLMRKQESLAVIEYMRRNGYDNLYIEDASSDFITALDGVVEPEKKRTIIGNMFLTVKESAFKRLKLNAEEWILAQGTIYPDTIESAGTKHADKIKTHHNRVDLILELIEKGLVIEPLAQLYKDEVRELGEVLGIPHELVWRHPFPGPGLGVRVLCSDGGGEAADSCESEELEHIVSPYGYKSCILPLKSVGVQGDERTYAHPALITGGEVDWDALEKMSTKITNSINDVNRVVYGLKVSSEPKYSLIKAYLTEERLNKLRAVDAIVTETLHRSGEYDTIWQMPVVLLPLVNNNGDETVVLRPIISQEAMTATFAPLKKETIDTVLKAVEEIEGIGDVFFDITHKPPGTIEWE
ncbi:GMP synthase [glutamine-hydrolyzing] [Chitinispirillum alkaliphilum]|nr:GMP synthase [glutamine-hydrolyzing] [Chitinispirillum alkaliphilum]